MQKPRERSIPAKTSLAKVLNETELTITVSGFADPYQPTSETEREVARYARAALAALMGPIAEASQTPLRLIHSSNAHFDHSVALCGGPLPRLTLKNGTHLRGPRMHRPLEEEQALQLVRAVLRTDRQVRSTLGDGHAVCLVKTLTWCPNWSMPELAVGFTLLRFHDEVPIPLAQSTTMALATVLLRTVNLQRRTGLHDMRCWEQEAPVSNHLRAGLKASAVVGFKTLLPDNAFACAALEKMGLTELSAAVAREAVSILPNAVQEPAPLASAAGA